MEGREDRVEGTGPGREGPDFHPQLQLPRKVLAHTSLALLTQFSLLRLGSHVSTQKGFIE